jgi:hypothetical protein
VSEAAKEAARADIVEVLVEAGAIRAQASNEAAKVVRVGETAFRNSA